MGQTGGGPFTQDARWGAEVGLLRCTNQRYTGSTRRRPRGLEPQSRKTYASLPGGIMGGRRGRTIARKRRVVVDRFGKGIVDRPLEHRRLSVAIADRGGTEPIVYRTARLRSHKTQQRPLRNIYRHLGKTGRHPMLHWPDRDGSRNYRQPSERAHQHRAFFDSCCHSGRAISRPQS